MARRITEQAERPAMGTLRALRYSTTLLIPLLAFVAFLEQGWWTWVVLPFSFVFIPIVELFWTGSENDLDEEAEAEVLRSPLFDALLYLMVPIQWGLLVFFLYRMSQGPETCEALGMTSTMGVLCGVYGINVAHELGHRVKRYERTLARALLLSSLYMHFIIEHNRGHHRRVATGDDPASARYGESIYMFWFRSITFSWISAWNIEADRLRKKGLSVWGSANEMLHAVLLQSALVVLILFVFGSVALVGFLAAAGIGVLLLETVNYIEHYGLRRVRTANGGYGRVQPVHSWNSDRMLGRLMLFELTRHSDHHWKASRKYQILKSHAGAPQLPTGYPGMMLLSLLPPLFFRVVHPRLEAIRTTTPDLELAIGA